MDIYVATYDWRPWGVFSTLEQAVQSHASMNDQDTPDTFTRLPHADTYISKDDLNTVILKMSLDFDPYLET